MRLHKVCLRNYRRHEQLTVDLVSDRVLVFGPNESGKSTLVEAIHRCLFYRHKSKAAGLLERMQPRSGGDPEVTLEFSLGQTRYTLFKKFRGASGSRAVLTDATGGRHEGDAAEEALQTLLGVSEVRGQQADAFNAQWAHLWVWQGSAHDEPGAALTDTTSRQLREQLQRQKGLGVIASPTDEAVRVALGRRAEEILGKGGRPKRTSRLGQAEHRLEAQKLAVTEATRQFNTVRNAIDSLTRAAETISEQTVRKDEAESQLVPTRQKLAEADRLDGVLKDQQQHLEAAQRTLAQLETTDTEICSVAAELATLDRQLDPDEQSLTGLKADLLEKVALASRAAEALNATRRELADLQEQRDLFAAERTVLQTTRDLATVTELLDRLGLAHEKIAALTRQLDDIPAIDEEAIAAIAEQEARLHRARLRVELMATRIEVLDGIGEVRLGNTTVKPGASSTISDVTEIVIDGTPRLLITPGGADSLAAAMQAVADAEEQLRRDLADRGATNLQVAREWLARRERLALEIDLHQREITTLLGKRCQSEVVDDQREQRQQLSEAQQKAAALRSREGSRLSAMTTPESLERLADAEAPLETAYEQLQQTLREQAQASEQATIAAAAAEQTMSNATDALDEARRSRAALQQRHVALEEIHGGPAARAAAIVQARQEQQTAAASVDASRQQLEQFKRSGLETDEARLERVLEQAQTAIQAAREARATAQGTLQSTGGLDIHLTLAEAEAGREAAEREHAAALREAQAVQLLRDRFEQLSRERADQVAAPLRQKAEDYLASLFGTGTAVTLSIMDAEPYLELRIARPGEDSHDFAFGELSGGTREQVAAALRLAMAEILAERYGGSLPVVFDDAFTNADPERLGMLQRMLDLAANRGLQVIVLSCNPADYRMFGAHEIDMQQLTAATSPGS